MIYASALFLLAAILFAVSAVSNFKANRMELVTFNVMSVLRFFASSVILGIIALTR